MVLAAWWRDFAFGGRDFSFRYAFSFLRCTGRLDPKIFILHSILIYSPRPCAERGASAPRRAGAPLRVGRCRPTEQRTPLAGGGVRPRMPNWELQTQTIATREVVGVPTNGTRPPASSVLTSPRRRSLTRTRPPPGAAKPARYAAHPHPRRYRRGPRHGAPSTACR